MNPLAFLQNINGPEILLIFLIVLLLFGAKRLPELSKSFGKSIREFKKATSDIEDDIRTAMDEEPKESKKPKTTPAPKQVESELNENSESSESTENTERAENTESTERVENTESTPEKKTEKA